MEEVVDSGRKMIMTSSVDRLEEIASVAFTIAGKDLDTDDISRKMKITPTHTHRAGDSDMIGKPFRDDMWQLESPLDRRMSLDDHLKWLTIVLEGHHDFIRVIKQFANVYIYCGINCSSDQCGFHITPGALRLFVQLEIDLEVTILC